MADGKKLLRHIFRRGPQRDDKQEKIRGHRGLRAWERVFHNTPCCQRINLLVLREVEVAVAVAMASPFAQPPL